MQYKFEQGLATPSGRRQEQVLHSSSQRRMRSRTNLQTGLFSCDQNGKQDARPARPFQDQLLLEKQCKLLQEELTLSAANFQQLSLQVQQLQTTNASLNRKLLDYLRRQNEMKRSLQNQAVTHKQVMQELQEELQRQQQSQQGQETTQLSIISTELEDFKYRMLQEQQQVRMKFQRKVSSIEQLQRQQELLLTEIRSHQQKQRYKPSQQLPPIIQSDSASYQNFDCQQPRSRATNY